MTVEEIKQDNVLIAKFMGMLLDETNHFKIPMGFPIIINRVKGGSRVPQEWLKFNTSWNWIMPVYQQIYDLGYDIKILSESVSIGSYMAAGEIDWHVEQKGKFEINTLYVAALEFIKYYNGLSTTGN